MRASHPMHGAAAYTGKKAKLPQPWTAYLALRAILSTESKLETSTPAMRDTRSVAPRSFSTAARLSCERPAAASGALCGRLWPFQCTQ